jgi:peroxiredoxin Q/BCP
MFSWLFDKPLEAGTPAPEFTLPDQNGSPVALSALHGRNVLLIFYPGDDTPVCRRQFCELRDSYHTLREKGVAVLGVNPQSASSHAGFREKHGLSFPLLVDAGQRVARLYHCSGLFVRRTVYLIGPDGRIRYARRGKPSVDEALAGATRPGY